MGSNAISNQAEAKEFLEKMLGEEKMKTYAGTWCVITDGELIQGKQFDGTFSTPEPFMKPDRDSFGTGYNGGAGVIIPHRDSSYVILTCNMDLLDDVSKEMQKQYGEHTYGYSHRLWVPCYNAGVQSDTPDRRVTAMRKQTDEYETTKAFNHRAANKTEAKEFLEQMLGDENMKKFADTWCVITEGELVRSVQYDGKFATPKPFVQPNKNSFGTGYNGGAGVIVPHQDSDYVILTCNMDLLDMVEEKMQKQHGEYTYGYSRGLWVPCYNAGVQSDTIDGRVTAMKAKSDSYKKTKTENHRAANQAEARAFLNQMLGEEAMKKYAGTWCVITEGEPIQGRQMDGSFSAPEPFVQPNKGSFGTGYNGGAGVIIPSKDRDYVILTCNMDLLDDISKKMQEHYGKFSYSYNSRLWVPCYNAGIQADTPDRRITAMRQQTDAYNNRQSKDFGRGSRD